MASGRAARSTVHARSHHAPRTITLPAVCTRSASFAEFQAIFEWVAIHSSCI
ncbi:hypothetical protein M404DRAFT_999809 [Pisolithus tinctorius Marx 270]|uniref:Uncharacterized protein n=1 Tax=Pisolithus tinctorius Marx 270 TaxID=870435 RepID=A0A0C3NWK9_PISTI|nr:hypothetical protein M404DRAFT_999809 [Pisolithus tinctorius Marx 270]